MLQLVLSVRSVDVYLFSQASENRYGIFSAFQHELTYLHPKATIHTSQYTAEHDAVS